MGAVMMNEDLIDLNPFEKENKPVGKEQLEQTLDQLMSMNFEEKPLLEQPKVVVPSTPFD